MDDLDRKIEEALNAEDRKLLEQFAEQNVWGLWFGIYRGKDGALALFATILTFALFFAAVYCGWKFFITEAAIDAARWGGGGVLAMVMVGFLKIWFWMRMESNRILREVKRLELQLARMTGKETV